MAQTRWEDHSAHTGQDGLDETILRLFQELDREEKQQFLTFFENALKTRSWPASDHRRHEKEAL